MKPLRYLNAILTVLAVLLGLHLWTAWMSSDSASLAQPALAQTRGGPTGGGIPDAGAQRKEMIDLLKRLNHQQDEIKGLLRSGEVRVRLENPPREPDVR